MSQNNDEPPKKRKYTKTASRWFASKSELDKGRAEKEEVILGDTDEDGREYVEDDSKDELGDDVKEGTKKVKKAPKKHAKNHEKKVVEYHAEEKFFIEKILSHKFTEEGELRYIVNWNGYKITTEELEEDLADHHEMLLKYHDSVGGKPIEDTETASKRRKVSNTTDFSGSQSKKRESDRLSKSTSTQTVSAQKSRSTQTVSTQGSWEDQVVSIQSMDILDDGKLWSVVLWKNGETGTYRNEVVHDKCPLKVIKFLEEHVVFVTPPPSPKPADVQPSNKRGSERGAPRRNFQKRT